MLALIIAVRCAVSATNSIVVPPDTADRFGNGSGGIVRAPTSGQVVYAKENFADAPTEVLRISGIAFRLDDRSGGFDVSIPEVRIWASTFEKPMSQLSKRQNENWGSDRKLVVSIRNARFTVCPDPFSLCPDRSDPSMFRAQLAFQNSFTYDRTRGALVLDLSTVGPYTGSTGFTDSDLRDDGSAFVIGEASSGEPVIVPYAEILKISYEPLPKLNVIRAGDLVQVSFFAASGQGYVLESTEAISKVGSWGVWTNIPAGMARPITVLTEPKGERRYFRVREEGS